MISDGNRPIIVRTARRLTIPTLLLAILFQGLSPQNALGNGVDWTARTSAADNNWYGVTFGNNLFVAVGASGSGDRVMTSPDGITWTKQTSAANSGWTSVTYGNGLFVAVAYSGTDRVMTSPDGITWTSRSAAASNQWTDVTYGNGLFVAVSDSGTNRVMTSPDGITWTSHSAAALNAWFGITYGNGLFVAVAYSGAGNRVMTSSNGTSWTTRSNPVDNSWVSVTYGNGLFVAVAETGSGNRVMTSEDGINWTRRSSAADNSWQGVTYGNGLFVAVAKTGSGNRVMTSEDGTNWTIRSNPVNNDWQSVTYGYGSFVAVGITGTGNRVMSTPLVIDTTAPTLSSTSVSSTGTTGTTLNFTSSETGTYYYKVQSAATAEPANAAAVESTATGTASATASANSVAISGLSAGTDYEAFLIVKDAAGNRSAVTKLTFSTAKLAQTITFNALSNRTLGTGTYSVSAASSSSLSVTLTSATTSVCTILSGTITLVSAGTCTINANQTGDATYLAATQVQQSFTVSNPPIAGNALNSKVTAPVRAATPSTTAVDDTQYTGTVAWFLSNGTTAAPSTFAANTVYVAKVTLTAKTGYTLTGLTGSFTYTGATDVSYSSGVVTITFAATDLTPRTISFGTTSYNKTYLETQVVSASASLGTGTITYSVGDSTACTINGSTVTISSGTGTCSVSATVASDGTHASATTTTPVTFTIVKADQSTLTVTSTGKTYDPASLTYTLTTSGGAGNGDVSYSVTTGTAGCSVSESTLTYTSAGTCSVTATMAGDNNYNNVSSSATNVVFGKANQTITFGSLSNKTLGSGTYSISATVSSTLAVDLASATTGVCTISSGIITLVAAGTCTINANQAGDSNYFAAPQVQQSFTVATALSITTPSGASLQGTYNTAFTSLTIVSSGGGGSNSFSATGSLPTGVTLSSAGVISGTPSIAGNFSLTVTVTDANGATATTSSFTISIAKGVTTVSISIPAYTFTGSPQGPDGATKTGSTGPITYAYVGRDGTSYTSSSTKPTAAGTYRVTATVAEDTNYAAVSTSADFEILNASLVITPTISASSMVYGASGGSLPTISHSKSPNVSLTTEPTCSLYLASDTGFATIQEISSTLAVGSYVVRCAGAAAINYTVTYGTNPSFSVTKANQTAISSPELSASSKTFPFSQTSLSVNSIAGGSGDGALSISSVANGTATGCSLSGSTLTASTSGTCTLTITKAASANFEAATTTATFTFNKATPTFSAWSNVSKSFGDSSFSVTTPVVTDSVAGSFAYSSGTTGVITIEGTILTVAGVGTSVITATFTPTDTTNYNNATTTMTVTVSAATLTVTWAPTTALLTTASPATPSTAATTSGNGGISYAVTSAGATGCTVNSSTGVLTFSTAGSCEVTATAAATSNYTTASKAVTFVISLATRTLTIDSGSFTTAYTMIATPPTITATASVGTGTKTFSSSTAAVCTINSTSGLVAFVSVGTCTIAASIVADSTYGSATSSSISFTTTLAAALTPTFGTPTATADGFTVTITNYSSSYTWAGTATASGTVSVNSSGLVTVTGVAAGTSSTATITTTRTNYTGGTANVSGTSIPVFTITYAAGAGGSGSAPTTPTSVSFGATFVAPANTFVKSGFTFAGWNDGSATYLAAATYPSTGTVSGNVTLTATWTGNICSPTSVTSGGYTRYTFTTVGTCFWDVPDGVSTVDVLVVGGGGGGGGAHDNATAGGGGAGYVYANSNQSISGTIAISVGAGGTGGVGVTQTIFKNGSPGGNSTFGSITALGGAGGFGGYESSTPWTGSCPTYTVPVKGGTAATLTQAATGGQDGCFNRNGFGGGGQSSTQNRTGGAGVANSITGTSVTYGTGGSGGTDNGDVTPTAQPSNTGNGGTGAASRSSFGRTGGTGGSGVVIVRVANANTVVFDSNTGSGTMTDQSIISGTATALTSNTFTKDNYTFAGWNTNANGTSGTNYSNGQSVTITAGMTLFAKWTLNTYAITFNKNSGDATGSMGNQSFTHGVALNLNANLYSRPNYVFYRWATAADGTGTTYNNLAQVTLTAATTLYAQWTANTYVVTYSYNGADGGESPPTAGFTTAGSPIALPVPTRTGFTFAGWHSDAALTTAIGSNNGSGTYSPTGATLSLNAYAKWTAVNYTFTYNANSAGSGTVPTETSKQITQTATIKANTGSLERAGYNFSGWNTASNGTGTTYLSGSLFTVGSANVILYAKWSANTYTITYNANGGTGKAQRTAGSTVSDVESDTFTTGNSGVVLPDVGTLARTGYTFGGWNTSAAGTGTNYLEKAVYTTVSNVIFYAKWNPATYTITYNGNSSDGGTAPTTGSYITGQASPYAVLANSYTKTSSIFGGWNTAADRTGTNYSPGASITTLANIVLYAIWIPQYTLHYAINGGTVTSGSLPADALLTQNTSVSVFSSVGRTGYNFDGWTNGASTIAPGGSFNILQNSVLTAKWTAINYTVSYNSDGGTTPPSSITRQIGQSYTIGNAPSKPGHDFLGWKTGTTVVGAGASIVMGSSDVTYTAQWAAQVYQISYDWNGGRGTAVADVNYTFGTTAITLPLVGDRVRDGYTFAGWSESLGGSALSATYIPSQSRTLYARWDVGSFTITYNLSGGTLATTTVAVPNSTATVLPLPTRANFVFDGWHTETVGGSSVGSNGASFTPTSSQTVYARWIQASLYGITNSLTRIGSVTTVANVANTFSGANSNSSVAVSIPENALPAGTTINFDMVGNSSRATGLLPNVNYLISIAISWITGDGLVPDTAANKPISVTISNATIRAGATAYAIVNNVSTLLGTASQDGTITIALTSDPEVVIAAVKPGAPTNVAATSNGNQQSIISWSPPSSNGGSAITGYTVTASPGAGTCTTSTTSCTISSLTNGTAYTFTVTATNGVGTSVASTSASATTAALYAVTFDAKGGSTVTSGSFLTASTVSEPTAPTRTGYSFAGWSATDGGSIITFPYAPGVTTAITLYARWDAFDNAVTFDSKGGSDVTASIFSSGGTVAEPTAPTRSGFTFAGWSATDGGTAVTFPYAPGVVTDITLYAKWTVVSQPVSGGGGGSSTPAPSVPSEPAVPSAPVKSNVTIVAPVTVVGDKDAKVIAVDIATPAPGSNTKPPAIKVDKASEKFIAEVKIVEGKLVLTPETGFSGKKTVTVTITENGADRIVQIPLTVLPEAVTKPVLTPTASNRSLIRWTESPNADGYTVFLNGKRVCTTTALSCSVKTILGPDANIEIVSNGGDRTVSQRVDAEFRQNVPVPITRLVSATITKATLTRVDTKALDQVVALIKNQGFGTVVISEITTTSKTKALAAARIESIKKYITSKIGAEEVEFEITPVKSRTYFNNISVKG